MPPTRPRARFIDAIGVSALAIAGAGLLAGTPSVVGAAAMLLAVGLVPAALLLCASRLVAVTARRRSENPVATRARR